MDALAQRYSDLDKKITAQADQLKLLSASIPASGLANSASAVAGGGTAEMEFLAAGALDQAAGLIADKVCGSGKLLVFPGASAPDLSDYRAVVLRLQEVQDAVAAARTAFEGQTQSQLVFLAGAAVIVPALVSYFSSADTLAGSALTADDGMFAAILAGQASCKGKIKISDRLFGWNAALKLQAQLQQTSNLLEGVKAAAAKWKAKVPTGDTANLPPGKALAAAYDRYDRAATDFAALTTSLRGKAGDSAAPNWTAVVKEAAVGAAIEDGDALFTKVHSLSGGVLTRKNLITTLGRHPFRVSAGAVVYFERINAKEDQLADAGAIRVLTPVQDLEKLAGSAGRAEIVPSR